MAAKDNEKKFHKYLADLYKEINLMNPSPYKDQDANVSISVDKLFIHGDTTYLIEIDSGNYAKLLVGQYVLLNQLYGSNVDAIFLVVHFYEDKKRKKQYNAQRTINNLRFVNDTVYEGDGLRFCVMNKGEFENLCEANKTLSDFTSAIIEKSNQQMNTEE